MNANTHSSIREDIRRRIVAGEWALGEQMPGEIDLASEYVCSRTTMNRALRALADEGIIERKRKGGTRVLPLPAPQAQLTIPILREQVESTGRAYRHLEVSRSVRLAPVGIRQRLQIEGKSRSLYIETLHFADEHPFAFECRWLNLAIVPAVEQADLDEQSVNEWLVRTVPFSRGEVSITATSAHGDLARALEVTDGTALFTLDRTTWFESHAVTTVTFYYAAGYRLEFNI